MSAPAVAVRERPILFSGPMVRAVLDGRKTQTRRVVTLPQWARSRARGEVLWDYEFERCTNRAAPPWPWIDVRNGTGFWKLDCPYGQPGDRLWVRESWGVWHREDSTPCGRPYDPEVIYRADDPDYKPSDYARAAMIAEPWRWRPSIHMRRRDSRITLEITDVRAERVREISCADAIAEGVRSAADCMTIDCDTPDPRREFATLWDSINAARGYGWDVNPYIWALTFRRIA